jgi:hypothetical protein
MTPGAGGGKSAVVAPTPAAPPPMKTPSGGYVPLDPWGVEGDATYKPAPWYGVFEDAAAAAAGTGPSMQFGISTGGGIVFLSAAEDESQAYVGMELGSTSSVFVQFGNGRTELSANASAAGVYVIGPSSGKTVRLVADDSGAGSQYLNLPESATGPPAPSSTASVFTQDDGSGKTQLCVQFPTGSPIVIATEL